MSIQDEIARFKAQYAPDRNESRGERDRVETLLRLGDAATPDEFASVLIAALRHDYSSMVRASAARLAGTCPAEGGTLTALVDALIESFHREVDPRIGHAAVVSLSTLSIRLAPDEREKANETLGSSRARELRNRRRQGE